MTDSADERTSAAVVHTLFEPCHDVGAMRAFYSDLIELDETFFDGDKGWLTYQAGPVQIVFTVPESPVAPRSDWSRTPAWDGGTVDAPAWVFRVPVAAFDPLVERLRAAGVEVQLRTSSDRRVNQVFALDPMGKTVEAYSEQEEPG